MTNHIAPDVLIESIEGPNGIAELHEITEMPTLVVYEVRCGGKSARFQSIGEAYIETGLAAGLSAIPGKP